MPATALTARLAALNPAAQLLSATFGEVEANTLFDLACGVEAPAKLARWLATSAPGEARQTGHVHDAEIGSIAIVRETPMRAVGLTLLLEVLAEHCGGDLLRLKGLVHIAECPERPAVIHGVQHVFHPPAWLRPLAFARSSQPSGPYRSQLAAGLDRGAAEGAGNGSCRDARRGR